MLGQGAGGGVEQEPGILAKAAGEFEDGVVTDLEASTDLEHKEHGTVLLTGVITVLHKDEPGDHVQKDRADYDT